MRAICAVSIGGVVALGVWRPPPVVVESPGNSGICPALQIVAVATLYDRVPPPSAPPELEAFVTALNTEMSTVRNQIEESCG